MRRRIFVATVASAASITGCLDDEMPDGNETDERDEDNGREGEDAAEDVAVVDTEFEVLERRRNTWRRGERRLRRGPHSHS